MRKTAGLLLLAVFYSVTMFAGDDQPDNNPPASITIHALDYCDPVSFARIGCTRAATPGFITLAGFGAELAAEKSVGAWRFVPSQTDAADGANLTITNLGGETHTFTRVKKFGGGFVAGLNAGSGNPTPAPECAKVVNGALVPQPPGPNNLFIAAGTSATAQVGEGEVARFQCCIHPWMRVTIGSGEEDGDGEDH